MIVSHLTAYSRITRSYNDIMKMGWGIMKSEHDIMKTAKKIIEIKDPCGKVYTTVTWQKTLHYIGQNRGELGNERGTHQKSEGVILGPKDNLILCGGQRQIRQKK